MGEPTITAVACLTIREALQKAGKNGDDVLRSAGVEPSELVPDRRIPLRRYHDAMRAAAEALGDPAFGVTLALDRPAASRFDLLGYLVMHSATLGDAILRLARFSGLWAQGIEVEVSTPPDAQLCYSFRAPVAQCWPHIQSAVAGSVVIARAITGRAWTPPKVEFTLPRPANEEPFRALFGDNIEWGAEGNCLRIDSDAWRYEVVGSDQRLSEHLEVTAQRLLVRLETDESVEGRARAHIARHLETTGVTLASTARVLGMSRRTLQRRLAEQNVSFAGLVDQVRRELALHLLEQENLEIKQAAFRLGFAQPSAFSRAFKRWTGHSPIAYTRL